MNQHFLFALDVNYFILLKHFWNAPYNAKNEIKKSVDDLRIETIIWANKYANTLSAKISKNCAVEKINIKPGRLSCVIGDGFATFTSLLLKHNKQSLFI